MSKEHPAFIQTTAGFIFRIESYTKGLFMINQGSFVIYYDILQELFFGRENGQLVQRELIPKHPEVFKIWMEGLEQGR